MIPIAVLCSDLHLSHTGPAGYKDWYDVMYKYLKQLKDLAERLDVPILCGGDVFDRWNSPPELVNFAIEHLPQMYAVPGQHDLPWHGYEQLRRSAYWTLMKAKVILNLEPEREHQVQQMSVFGFPWGFPLQAAPDDRRFHVAVCHQYLWIRGHAYPNAPKEFHASTTIRKLKGFQAALFGDNHKGFQTGMVLNPGVFIRRTVDDREHRPMIGVLEAEMPLTSRSECVIRQEYLDTSSDDAWLVPEQEDEDHGLDRFLAALENQDAQDLDFLKLLRMRVEDPQCDVRVRRAIEEILDELVSPA